MLEFFTARPGDRYQVVTEHSHGQIFVVDSGLGLERTAEITIIQIFQQGRDAEQKMSAYTELARQLEARCGIWAADLVISIVENTRENWSFGPGRAQFVTGEL